jgi:VanZ family protein
MAIPASESPQFRARTFWLKYWLPTLAWLGVIAVFSTRPFGAGRTGIILRWLMSVLQIQVSESTFDTVHFFWRKGAHCFAYGMLSLLMFRALRGTDTDSSEWKARYLIMALLVCVLTAIFDETHQYFAPGRTGNPYDVLLDSVAAIFVQLVILVYVMLRAGRMNKSINPDSAARPADR